MDIKKRRNVAGSSAILLLTGALSGPLAGCATVKLEAPDKPIEINLNVKIEQELRIKIEKDIEDLITDNPDIF